VLKAITFPSERFANGTAKLNSLDESVLIALSTTSTIPQDGYSRIAPQNQNPTTPIKILVTPSPTAFYRTPCIPNSNPNHKSTKDNPERLCKSNSESSPT
jgi:hypothetical protein